MTAKIVFSGKAYAAKELRDLRKSHRLSHQEFWNAVGCTESIGLMYEDGNAIPPLVAVAVELVHELGCNIGSLDGRLQLSKLLNQQRAIQQIGAL